MKKASGLTGGVRHLIYQLRGHRVMLDLDLADIYGVSTSQLNQAVSRNIRRFPDDFMFEITPDERQELITICDNPSRLKFYPASPKVFTEQGVAMLSGVLKSPKAVAANIAIMRAFVKLRAFAATQEELSKRLIDLEGKVERNEGSIHEVFEAIRQLMAIEERPRPRIGFRASEEAEATKSRKRHP